MVYRHSHASAVGKQHSWMQSCRLCRNITLPLYAVSSIHQSVPFLNLLSSIFVFFCILLILYSHDSSESGVAFCCSCLARATEQAHPRVRQQMESFVTQAHRIMTEHCLFLYWYYWVRMQMQDRVCELGQWLLPLPQWSHKDRLWISFLGPYFCIRCVLSLRDHELLWWIRLEGFQLPLVLSRSMNWVWSLRLWATWHCREGDTSSHLSPTLSRWELCIQLNIMGWCTAIMFPCNHWRSCMGSNCSQQNCSSLRA